MGQDVTFNCRCGTVGGTVHGVGPGAGCHLICYCRDCRAAAHYLGQDDALVPGGGSAIYQTSAARVEVTQGQDHIACLRLSPKGLHRWYAACCDTPLANTVGTPKIPFIGLWRGNLSDLAPLGPVQTHGFTKFAEAGPGVPKKDRGLALMIWGTLRRTATAYLNGTVHPHPLFARDGTPITVPTVLSAAQRERAYTTN